MKRSLSLTRTLHLASPIAALALLAFAMQGTWSIGPVRAAPTVAASKPSASTSPPTSSTSSTSSPSSTSPPTSSTPASTAATQPDPPWTASSFAGRKAGGGKLNLNTATEEQLVLLPSIGPSKAERIVAWRKRNGGFKRIADLRRVKGFGYKTFKKLEPFLAIEGETKLIPRR